MSSRRGRAIGVAISLVMIVVPLSLEGLDFRSFAGYPAVGFAIALLLLVSRRRLWWWLLVETVIIGIALTRTYDVSPVLGFAATTTITVPAIVVWRLLTGGGRHRFQLESSDGERGFFVATALGALLCGTIGGALALTAVSPSDALLTAVMSILSSLAAQLAVLPVLVRSSRSASGGVVERVLIWVVLLVTVVIVFVPNDSLPVAFLVPAVLSWGANRDAPRSSHVQLLVVSVAAYLFTFAGQGPLVVLPDWLPESSGPILLYLFLVACAYAAIPISVTISRMQRVTVEATKSASMMERLFESARLSLIITTDTAGVITRVNRGAELILGYTAEELLGRTPWVFHSPAEVARQARRLGLAEDDLIGTAEAMAESGAHWDWEVLTRRGPRFVSMSLTTIVDDDGSLLGFLAVGEDTTEQRAATEAMRTALEHEHASVNRLREVDRVKQELVSNVSHELRTPITSIHGYAELLAEGAIGELTDDQQEVVARIDRNSQRLIRLVEDLLTLSRLESGVLMLHRAPTDLVGLVGEVGLLLEEQLRHRALDLVVHVPDEPVVLHADGHELERVLVNLVGNAIKFTPDGGRIDLSLHADPERAVITVADTGLGIAADELEQLFGRFFRASSAIDNAIQGTGLGLSIAHAIVTAHGGTIGVESQPGEGTTMRVSLPRDDDEVDDEPLFRH